MNVNWNAVWDVKTSRTDRGYALEMIIPFKSLRYRSAGPQVWGINMRRVIKSKNEVSMLTRVPASYSSNGVAQMAVAATLVGLETPAQSMNLELKPYLASSLTTDRTARVPFSNDFGRDVGIDVKYGLTRGHDGRPYGQHRLRPGRGRPAADQPHAVQPVLPREARFLPRRAGDLRVWRPGRVGIKAARPSCSSAGGSA